MKPISIRVLAQALGCQCAGQENITHISTDSRDITPGCLFVCIEGERFDGHDFAAQALEKGAGYIVAHKRIDVPEDRVFYVDNTLDANIKLAGAYRSLFSPLTVGITGSVGKTTTKDFIAGVLSARYRTLKTQGNQNNEIGLPQTLLRLDDSVEAMAVEMGMNARGDIDKLAAALCPDIAVITFIGTSHIEFLGSRENILRAKLEVADHLRPGSPLILCGDNDLLREVHSDRVRIVFYGIENEKADIRAANLREEGGGTAFTLYWQGGSCEAFVPTLGRHHVLDAAAAFAVGLEAGVPLEGILQGLKGYAPSGMRQRRVEKGGVTVVEDCYNASPDSMHAAVDTLREMPAGGRRIAVFGDMLELGTTSKEAHREIGEYCAKAGIDWLLCYGAESRAMLEGARESGLLAAEHFEDKDSLLLRLSGEVRAGDIVWLKASHGMRLEEILPPLYRRLEEE